MVVIVDDSNFPVKQWRQAPPVEGTLKVPGAGAGQRLTKVESGGETRMDRFMYGDAKAGNRNARMMAPSSNGAVNGQTNGHVNGYGGRQVNGDAGEYRNGNGHANGYTNGTSNGYTNGHTNGHTNGYASDSRRESIGYASREGSISGSIGGDSFDSFRIS